MLQLPHGFLHIALGLVDLASEVLAKVFVCGGTLLALFVELCVPLLRPSSIFILFLLDALLDEVLLQLPHGFLHVALGLVDLASEVLAKVFVYGGTLLALVVELCVPLLRPPSIFFLFLLDALLDEVSLQVPHGFLHIALGLVDLASEGLAKVIVCGGTLLVLWRGGSSVWKRRAAGDVGTIFGPKVVPVCVVAVCIAGSVFGSPLELPPEF